MEEELVVWVLISPLWCDAVKAGKHMRHGDAIEDGKHMRVVHLY